MMERQRLLDYLPAPLLADFRAGRWLPVVGAGLSLGALDCGRDGMPDWNGLGQRLARHFAPAYKHENAVETISAYEYANGRPKLTEAISAELFVGRARPSSTQLAFASLPFEHVVTTNVEHLLEDAYRQHRGHVFTVVEDGQLRISNPYMSPVLVKIHGDLHRPSTLVLTEDDYDNVHLTRPLMLTWLAGQLITKTGVLIGYSLGDPDIRLLLASLRKGLGASPPDLWVLTIDNDPVAIDRYRRRGVRVVSLPKDARDWGILTDLFDELLEESKKSTSEHISGTTTLVDAALKGGRRVDSSVFFHVPEDRLRLYSEFVFPAVVASGFLPLSRADVRASDEFVLAASDSLLSIAGAVVISTLSRDDAAIARARKAVGAERTVVLHPDLETDDDIGAAEPQGEDDDAWTEFASQLTSLLISLGPGDNHGERPGYPLQDLRSRTLVTVIDFEAALRGLDLELWRDGDGKNRNQPLRSLLIAAINEGIIDTIGPEQASEIVAVRNSLVHKGRDEISPEQLERVLILVERSLPALEAYLRYSEGPRHADFTSLLHLYESRSPQYPHRELALGFEQRQFVALPGPETYSYIRWLAVGKTRRLTIYQLEDGIMVDSRVYGDLAGNLPGATLRGRRVFFGFAQNGLPRILETIGRLRDAADVPKSRRR